MLKHLPAFVFFLCLCVVVVNASVFDRADVYGAAIALGTAAMVVQHFQEKKVKDAAAGSTAQQQAHWQAQWSHVDQVLREARKSGDDRIPFLESQLADAERQLKKLGAAKPSAKAE